MKHLDRLRYLEARANIRELQPPQFWFCVGGRCWTLGGKKISQAEFDAWRQLPGAPRVIVCGLYDDLDGDGLDLDDDTTAPRIGEG